MTEYKCFNCNRTIKEEQVKKRIRCVYCGAKIIFKTRSVSTKVDAI
ncbi:DNA-directed RNA polymerase subunit P [Candidatus Woesearchaeota archaeon]|nr:DNA-directed RNA polymerase subunit P [Candidatus Woesearchaeota archaeon]